MLLGQVVGYNMGIVCMYRPRNGTTREYIGVYIPLKNMLWIRYWMLVSAS